MSIEWSSSLATGLEWQDRHHKELFKRINRLLEAMTLGYGKDELVKVFDFLDDYFVFHFEAEEQAMSKFGYPGIIPHLAEHTGFIERVAKLREECQKGPSTTLAIRTQREVVDWLINHIGGIDKTLGAFLLKAGYEKHAVD